jgi:flagellar biosynthesis GTPase FlhF
MQACADERLDFELFPSLDEVEVGEEVRLLATPFAGHQVTILEKRRTKTGVRLTVDVQLSNTPIKVRLYDIRDEDLQYDRVSERKQQSRDSKLVTRFQRDLIDILSRRINDKETPESRRADAATLDNIFLYRNYRFTSDPLRRRFLAMMLICAHQRHDDEATAALLRSAQEELALLDARPESRAATDVRAYLHLALYLATADPQYRAAAKQYVRDRSPKSDDLRRLLSLLCRREASKIL